MSTELPPQVQNQLAQLQQVQQQAQMLIGQKNQVSMMLKDTEMALKELEKLDEDSIIYKNVGEILIKANKNKTLEELTEKKDMLDLRLKTLSRQEERVQNRYKQLQEQIKQSLSMAGISAQ